MPVINYLWDPETAAYLMEMDGNDQTTAVYTNEPVLYGSLVSQRRGGETSCYHYDGLGNTCELTNASEVVTDTNLYDAWGVNINSTGTTESPFKWRGLHGYYFDTITNRFYVRARVYQPIVGRWMTPDPLQFYDGSNLFAAYFIPGSLDPSGLVGKKGPICLFNCDNSGGGSVRTDDQCCSDAEAEGKFNMDWDPGPAASIVICCDYRKVPCSMKRDPIDPDEDWYENLTRANEIMYKCSLEHERTHFGHIEDCPTQCPYLDRPPFKPGLDRKAAECDAYDKQLECLAAGVRDCGDDWVCEMAVLAELRELFNYTVYDKKCTHLANKKYHKR